MSAVNLDRMAAHYATFSRMPSRKFRVIVSLAAIGAIWRAHRGAAAARPVFALAPQSSRNLEDCCRRREHQHHLRPPVDARAEDFRLAGAVRPRLDAWRGRGDDFSDERPAAVRRLQAAAGSYSLYTLPAENKWTLIINKMTGQFHTYYPEDQDLAKLPMTIERLSTPVEQLTIEAVARPQGGALQLEWELTRVSAPFSVLLQRVRLGIGDSQIDPQSQPPIASSITTISLSLIESRRHAV